MFEFIKELNNKLIKIDNKTKKKYVYHMDKELRNDIRDFLKEKFPDYSDNAFYVILDKFFDTDREIYFEKNRNTFGLEIYYSYDDDSFEDKSTIRLSSSSVFFEHEKKNRCEITLSGKDYRLVYTLQYVNENFISILKSDMKNEYIDGKGYFRKIDKDGYNIRITDKNNMGIILTCSGNVKGIKNESELKEYLLNVDKTTPIRDIYNRIYSLSLVEDKNINKVDLIITEKGNEISKLHIDDSGLGLLNRKHQYEIIENGNRISYLYEEPSHTMFANSWYDGVINIYNGDIKIAIIFPYFSGCSEDDLLRDYLLNLEFPVKIEDICKEVFKEFGNDACFKIEIMYNERLTDFIKIYKGNLLEFKCIKDGRIVSINENGVFSYESLNGKKKMIVEMIDDIVTRCDYSSLSGIESDDMSNSIYNGINDAKDVKVRTRKLIDEMLKKDNS